ncbi:hypothetical protein LCGC14_1019860 [marine sediment metagenome]|uniref:ASCH domain-containing protein n=1 Tax=marine sediment metagenome TaxID=412755 RepID=A0A0F9MXR6_9ZZZZ
MKALSLTQPMAWAIFHGKDVENRTWRTRRRDRIYIHASQGFDKVHYAWITANEIELARINRITCFLPEPEEFIHGAIIGAVDIVDCVLNHGSRWFTGPFGLVLANPVEFLRPIPCKGTIFPLFFEPKPDPEKWHLGEF